MQAKFMFAALLKRFKIDSVSVPQISKFIFYIAQNITTNIRKMKRFASIAKTIFKISGHLL